jgi:PST family polysaccharide transporter
MQAAQFAVGLILARLLAPEDFGLFASVSVIVSFGVVIFEGGLHSALVHAKEPEDRDYSTVFWTNALGGILLAGLVWGLAPWIADFFGEPVLLDLAPLVGLTFAVHLGLVHDVILRRQSRYRASALVPGLAMVFGLVVTLVLAFAGAGVFALAIGPLAAQAVSSISYFIVCGWRPRSFISLAALRGLLPYAVPLVGANIVDYWGKNADNLLIGRFLGAAQLGFYNRAYNLVLLPLNQVLLAAGGAVSPALARMREEPARLVAAYRRSFRGVAVISVPVMAGLAVVAPGAVPLLWGPQWVASVPLLQLLSIAGIPQVLTLTTSWLYQARDRTGTMFRVALLWNGLGIVGMVVGLQWGAAGVAAAVLARYWIGLPFELAAAVRGVPVTVGRLLMDAAIPTLAAVVMAGLTWLLPAVTGWEREEGWVALIQILVGAAAYILALALMRRESLREVLTLVKP